MPEPLDVPSPPGRGRSRRPGRRFWVTGGVVIAVPVVIAGVIGVNRTTGPTYRTAAVDRGDVESTLESTGTVQSLNEAELSFPVAGDVRGVPVVVGQHVTVGQTLAQLDTTALDAQVATAQSTVAAAQARLVTDGQNQSAAGGVAPAAFVQPLTPADPVTAARQLVTERQTGLVADQHQADQDLAQAQHDLTTETGRCQAFLAAAGGSTSAAPTGSGTPSSTPSATSTPQPPSPKTKPGSATPAAPAAGACQAALATVLTDQQTVSHDQQVLAADLPALDDAVDKLVAVATTMSTARSTTQSADQSPSPQDLHQPAVGAAPAGPGGSHAAPSTPGGPAPGKTARPGAASGSPAGGSGRTVSSARPVSAEQLAADQAAVDAAQAQLTTAQQAHDQAELVSPISGTVASVAISPGQSVTSGSATPQIIVIGPGSQEVSTTVSDTDVGSVRVGDPVTITPSGTTTPRNGQVVSIGLLATAGSTSTSGSVSYPITIGLIDPGRQLPEGGRQLVEGQQLIEGQSASVSIMLAHVSDTLTVPSSAVHTLGANHTVTVLRGGSPTNVRVTLGTTGPTRTQVLSGLAAGDQVVLADLSQPLPATDVGNVRRAVGGGRGG
ncbi:MAG TPA: HlyD family efflux transporter periplasmic adaptor subunit [Pseudonocardiaceae bacterium]